MTPNGFAQVCYSLSNIEKTMLRVVYEWRGLKQSSFSFVLNFLDADIT